MTPDPRDIEKLEELEKKATPGPWFRGADEEIGHDPGDGTQRYVCDFDKVDRWWEDRELIVEARNLLPSILEERRRLREALAFYADPETYATWIADETVIDIDEGAKARAALGGE